MNTKEQELFWQAVGFKKKRRKVDWYRRSGDRKTVVVSPDNDIFIQGCLADGSNYPDMDANNFFKWVLPKLKECGWGFSIDTRWQEKSYDWVSDLYEQAWRELK